MERVSEKQSKQQEGHEPKVVDSLKEILAGRGLLSEELLLAKSISEFRKIFIAEETEKRKQFLKESGATEEDIEKDLIDYQETLNNDLDDMETKVRGGFSDHDLLMFKASRDSGSDSFVPKDHRRNFDRIKAELQKTKTLRQAREIEENDNRRIA